MFQPSSCRTLRGARKEEEEEEENEEEEGHQSCQDVGLDHCIG